MLTKLGNCAQCQSTLALDDNHPKLRPGNVLKIKCPRCTTINSIKMPAERIAKPGPERQPQQQAPLDFSQEVGWLVLHDEQTALQTFPLKLGKNIIGRFSPDKPSDIMIKTNDIFMSRHHSVIEVAKRSDDTLVFLIFDIANTNGTYINAGRKLSTYDKLILQDGDTIQLGNTKVVLKIRQASHCQSAEEATNAVKGGAYYRTVRV